LLSYLTIKAYEQNKLNNDPQSVATLNNNLIYPGGGYESINDVVDRMRTTEAGQNNFFLDNFAISEKATDAKNQTGLNLLNANTFRSLNAGQKVDLQNSFAKLYGSLETKDDALSIINYIMVKDGLQVGYASLLEAISPFTMDSYLSQIETANKALRTNDDANIKKVFGLNRTELESDFVNNYLQSNINGPLLYTVSINDKTGLLPKGVTVEKNKITIKWDDMGKASPKDFVRYRIEDIQTGFVTYKTYISTTQDESTTKVYEEVETKGSNQQTPIGFMFGERPTYKEVRQSIKTKNATTGQDAYVDNIQFEAEENYALSAAEMVQLEALNDESANIEATEFGVNINGNNIANISALEAMLQAEPKQKVDNKISKYASILKEISIRRAMATDSDLKNSQLIKDIRVDKSQPNAIEPNKADLDLTAIMLYGKRYDDIRDKYNGRFDEYGEPIDKITNGRFESKTLAYRILNDLLFNLNEINEYILEIVENPEYAAALTTNENPVKDFFENEIFNLTDSIAEPKTDMATTLFDSMSDLERELYDEFAAEMESDYSAIENFWDANIQKNTQAKENLRLNNNVLSLEDLIDMYNNGIYTSQEEFIEQIKQCNL
jgi:hypothetical protein